MRRFGIFVFNVLLGLAFATAFALVLQRAALAFESLEAAFAAAKWVGLTIGVTIGLAASVGPRYPLTVPRCLYAHSIVLATTALGAILSTGFHEEIQQTQQAMTDLLARHNIAMGSGIGAVIGTVWEFIDVYRMRRKKDE